MNRRGVVVDANIARSVGPSDRPPAPDCLGALEAITASALRVPVSAALDAEWSRHGSRWFQKWRARMYARGRVEVVADARREEHQGRLRRAVSATAQKEAVAKDAHLVSLAIDENAAVLSADEVMRVLLAAIAHTAGWHELGQIAWGNPTLEDLVPWIRQGAPPEPVRTLARHVSGTTP